MKRRYVVQTGEMSHSYMAQSAGRAFRHMLRVFDKTLEDCAVLVRFKVKDQRGQWSRWQYQDPSALKKEP